MPKSSKMGMNRTGIDMAPEMAGEMIEGAQKMGMPKANGAALTKVRQSIIAEVGRVGSVPIPATFKGVLQTAKGKATGKSPEVFIDKLGERLAFERSGVRLYDLFIAKCEAGAIRGLFSLNDVKHIQEEEAQHFKLVSEVMESIGADPTAQTPAADAIGVASMGLVQVLSDPRTSLAQGLDALLTAELVDNVAWDMLIQLAEGHGMTDTAEQFRRALAEEDEHLEKVKQWSQAAILKESGVAA